MRNISNIAINIMAIANKGKGYGYAVKGFENWDDDIPRQITKI